MKKYGMLVITVVLAVAAIWIAVGQRKTGEPGNRGIHGLRPDDAADRDLIEDGPREGKEPEMRGARPGPLVDSPLLSGEDGQKMYETVSRGYMLSKREEGVYTALYPYPDATRDMAMVELRFKERGETGELQPLTVEHVWVRRRIGDATEIITSLWELGGTKTVEGHTYRVGAGPPGEGNNFLGFGRRYHLQYKIVDPDSEDEKFCESIIKVPDTIGPGKMAVITVIAKYPARTFEMAAREKTESLRGRITVPLPPAQTQWLAAYTHPDESESAWSEIDRDGSFGIGRKAPGGMLRIAEQGGQGVAWMWVQDVQKRQLTLPEDADQVISMDRLKEVNVAVPQSRINDAFVGLWLKAGKDDTGPIAWKAFRTSTGRDFRRFRSSGIVRMKVPAGQYWASALYDPGSWDKREWVTLGRITVPEGSPEDPIKIQAAP